MKSNDIIEWCPKWSKTKSFGIIIKKASKGYWVLWADGKYKVLPRHLMKYTKVVS